MNLLTMKVAGLPMNPMNPIKTHTLTTVALHPPFPFHTLHPVVRKMSAMTMQALFITMLDILPYSSFRLIRSCCLGVEQGFS